jgi:hypothetical protein
MKTKALSLIAVAAIATLSFTFVTVKTKNVSKDIETKTLKVVHDEPIGGFAMEDKL